jgi:hypothetical protein
MAANMRQGRTHREGTATSRASANDVWPWSVGPGGSVVVVASSGNEARNVS